MSSRCLPRAQRHWTHFRPSFLELKIAHDKRWWREPCAHLVLLDAGGGDVRAVDVEGRLAVDGEGDGVAAHFHLAPVAAVGLELALLNLDVVVSSGSSGARAQALTQKNNRVSS